MKKLVVLYCLLFLSSSLFSQWEEQKIIPNDNGSGDFFGRYLCLKSGDLLVGAHEDDENGYASGSLYLFQYDPVTKTFTETEKFFPEDGDVEEFFGYSIDIYGEWAITGSHHDSDYGGSSGSVFLLNKTGQYWDLHQKIIANDPKAGDEFGKSVGIWENKLAVGAFLDDDQATNSGSVYFFQRVDNDWQFSQEIFAEDAKAYDQFGHFLVFRDNRLVVGVPEKQETEILSGCVYVFEEKSTGFVQDAQLFPPNASMEDHFGQAVDTQEDWLVVGAYKSDAIHQDGGAVYLYNKTDEEWQWKQTLIPPDNQEGDHFGSAVSLEGNWLAVGAYFDDDNGSKSGSVYLFEKRDGQYVFSYKILASDGGYGDAFGAALDLDENFLVVGAYADSENGFFSGSAYLYNLSAITQNKDLEVKEPEVSVMPVCFDQYLSVRFQEEVQLPAPFTLRDMWGNLILKGQFEISENELTLSFLPSGVYLLEIQQASMRHLFKVIKK